MDEIESEMTAKGFVTSWDRMHGRTMARWVLEYITGKNNK